MSQPHTYPPIQSLTGDTTCKIRASTARQAADCLTIHAKRKGGVFMGPRSPISGQLSLQNPPQFNYSAGPGREPRLSPILSKCWPRMPRQELTFQAQVALPTRTKAPTHQIQTLRGPLCHMGREGLTHSRAANHFPQRLLQRGQAEQKPLSCSHHLNRHTLASSLGTELKIPFISGALLIKAYRTQAKNYAQFSTALPSLLPSPWLIHAHLS